jgi:Deoxycytidylate deaminase
MRWVKQALEQRFGDEQISWDELWLSQAIMLSYRSRCVRDRVGAVMVTDANLVISSSYNGAPPTFAGDTGGPCREWCPRATATAPGVPGKPGYEDCFASHAETNAVKRAPHVDSLTTTRLYVSRVPCYRCAVEIASARITHGLTDVVAPVSLQTNAQHGDVNRSVEFLAKCDVRVRLV